MIREAGTRVSRAPSKEGGATTHTLASDSRLESEATQMNAKELLHKYLQNEKSSSPDSLPTQRVSRQADSEAQNRLRDHLVTLEGELNVQIPGDLEVQFDAAVTRNDWPAVQVAAALIEKRLRDEGGRRNLVDVQKPREPGGGELFSVHHPLVDRRP